jgi:hypothetical protein
VQRSLASLGSVAAPSTPEAMREMVQQDIARWRAVVARAGIEVQA